MFGDEGRVLEFLTVLEILGLPKATLSPIQKEFFLRSGLDSQFVDIAVEGAVEDYQYGKAHLQSIMDTWKS